MMSRTSKVLAGVATVALSAGALAGCAASDAATTPESPAMHKLLSAAGKLGDSDDLTATLSLHASAGQIVAAHQARGAKKTMTTDQATFLSTGRVVESITGSTPLKNLGNGGQPREATETRVITKGVDVVDVRHIGQQVYARVDVPQILAWKHTQLPTRFRQAETSSPGLRALASGHWISVSRQQLQSLHNMTQSNGSTQSSPSPGKIRQLAAGIEDVVTHDATVTDKGMTSQGDHLVATVQSRQFLNDLSQAVAANSSSQGNLSKIQQRIASLPDRPVSIDAYVRGGTLSAVSVNLSQFQQNARARAVPLPLTMTFATTASPVTVPSGATPVDLTQVFQQLYSGQAHGMGAPGQSPLPSSLLPQLSNA